MTSKREQGFVLTDTYAWECDTCDAHDQGFHLREIAAHQARQHQYAVHPTLTLEGRIAAVLALPEQDYRGNDTEGNALLRKIKAMLG